MVKNFKAAWGELESFQKIFLIAVTILLPLGLVFPPAMELLMLPMAFLSCVG